MEEELNSEGKCLYCGQTFSQQDISKHIATHLAVVEKEQKTPGASAWHIKVEAAEMFLHLLVSGNATFKTLDKYLRDIWVECCGHMSAFQHKNMKISMSNKLDDVCAPRLKFGYEYDFGTTTYLDVIVMKRYAVDAPKNIILISRNEPLKLMCTLCKKKPAVNICSACMWDSYSYFCESCSEKHAKECEDFGDYGNMPIVNSPRMGVCGYEGGVIDTERDGHYKKTTKK